MNKIPLFLSLLLLSTSSVPGQISALAVEPFSFPNIDSLYGEVRAGYGVNPNAADPSEIILGLGIKYALTTGPDSGNEFRYEAQLIRESSDVFKERSASAEAEARYLMYSGKASFSINEASRKTTDSIMWRVTADKDYGVRERVDLSRVELTDVARARWMNDGYDAFVRQFGTRFISSWSRKAHLSIIFEAYSLTQEDERHVNAMIAVSGQYAAGSASAKASMSESFRSLSSSARTRVSFTADGIAVDNYFAGATSLTSLDQIQDGIIRLLSDIEKQEGNVAQYYTTPYSDVIVGFPLVPPYPKFPEQKKAQDAFEKAYVVKLQAENFKIGPRGPYLEAEELDYLNRKIAECDDRLAQIDAWLKQFKNDSTLKARSWPDIALRLPELKWYAAKPFQAAGSRGHAATVFPVFVTGGNEVGGVFFRSQQAGSVIDRVLSVAEEAQWPSPNAFQSLNTIVKMDLTRDTNGSRRRWILWYDQWTLWATIQQYLDFHQAGLQDKAGNFINDPKDRDGRFIFKTASTGKAIEPYPGPSGDLHYKLLRSSADGTSFQHILEPIDGARFTGGQSIELATRWYIPSGSGSPRMKFLIDGSEVPGGSIAPASDSASTWYYRHTLRNASPGTHTFDVAPAGNEPVAFKLAPISFTVNPPVIAPSITVQPRSVNAPAGSTVVLSATVAGSELLLYAWHRDGKEVFDSARFSGSASSTLTITPASSQDSGKYTLVVKNSSGIATTDPAQTTINDLTVSVIASPAAGGTVSGGGSQMPVEPQVAEEHSKSAVP